MGPNFCGNLNSHHKKKVAKFDPKRLNVATDKAPREKSTFTMKKVGANFNIFQNYVLKLPQKCQVDENGSLFRFSYFRTLGRFVRDKSQPLDLLSLETL